MERSGKLRGEGEVGDGCGLGGEEHKRGCEQAGQGDFGWRAALGAPRFVADFRRQGLFGRTAPATSGGGQR